MGRKKAIEDLLIHTEPVDSDAAQVLTSMAYDSSYGIYDHYDPNNNNPLEVVGMHDAEMYHKASGLYKAIERYERYDIHNRFGLSLTEYLDLPRDIIDSISDVVISIQEKLEAIENKQEAEANRDAGKKNPWKHL